MSAQDSMSFTWPPVPVGAVGKRQKKPRVGFAGVLGEIFITIGIILALFIAWELAWTNILAAFQQTAAVKSFTSSSSYVQSPLHAGPHQTGPAPALPQPAAYETIGTLHIPRFSPNYNVPIVEAGTTNSNENSPDRTKILNKGYIQHYMNTALPGQVGNFGLAGHRSTYGRPFQQIADLQDGDELIVETGKYWFVYTVTSHEIVSPDNQGVLAPDPDHPGQPPTVASITLTACHPMYSASQRYIVHGKLSYWMNKADGYPDAFISGKAKP